MGEARRGLLLLLFDLRADDPAFALFILEDLSADQVAALLPGYAAERLVVETGAVPVDGAATAR